MKKEELKKLTSEELRQKEKNTKGLLVLLAVLTIVLASFVLWDYFAKGEAETSLFIIVVCSVGGVVSLVPGLQAMREELRSRP